MRNSRAREPRSKEVPPEFTGIARACDLVWELGQRVVPFPRDFRFRLGDCILNNVYDFPEPLIEACCTRNRSRVRRTYSQYSLTPRAAPGSGFRQQWVDAELSSWTGLGRDSGGGCGRVLGRVAAPQNGSAAAE